MSTGSEREVFKEILAEYRRGRYKKKEELPEELVRKFKATRCSDIPCKRCLLDKEVGKFVVCDHLIHGARVTDWDYVRYGSRG